MPRYLFDTDDGDTFIKGDQGLNLKDLEAARRHAQDALADLARDAVPGDTNQRTMTVRVRDQAGNTVLKAALVLMIERSPVA